MTDQFRIDIGGVRIVAIRDSSGLWSFEARANEFNVRMQEADYATVVQGEAPSNGPYAFGTGRVQFDLVNFRYCWLKPDEIPLKTTMFLGGRRAGKSQLVASNGFITGMSMSTSSNYPAKPSPPSMKQTSGEPVVAGGPRKYFEE